MKKREKAPIDLPRRYSWARDELVRLRLENSELRGQVMHLRFDLARANGEDAIETLCNLYASMSE